MDQEPKKISFGFSKQLKKTNLFTPTEKREEKLDLIECLEKQAIKIIGDTDNKKCPLVIPLLQNRNLLHEKLKQNNLKSLDEPPDNNSSSKTLTLDELAAQELLNDARNTTSKNSDIANLTIKVGKPTLEGETESTIDDYENVPISEFGRAMLRGMGWKDDDKNTNKTATYEPPVVRAKGMGLGADKAKQTPSTAVDSHGEELKLVKNAYVKIILGRHVGSYGQVHGLDDDSGSVIVKMALGGKILTLSEFLLQPITKENYFQNSKVINADKYKEYKNSEPGNLKESKNQSQKHSSKERRYKDYNGDENDGKRDSYRSSRDREEYSSKTKSERNRESSKKDERHYSREKRKDKKHKRRNRSRSRSRS